MNRGFYFQVLLSLTIGVYGLLPANWDRCREQMHLLKNKIDTMGRVARLRDKMAEVGIHAYIVPSDNFHLSAVVAEHDRRLEYISGYNMSKGTAVVTMQYAALWLDGDQLNKANDQVGCGWLLADKGEDEITSISQWLGNVLPKTATTRVGGSPFFFRYDVWIGYATRLSYEDVALVGYTPDLVDLIWTVSRPQMPSTSINSLPMRYAGKTWQSKLHSIHLAMIRHDADLLILTALDEPAWVFNLRASEYDELSTNTYFYSLAILDLRRNKTILYLKDHWQKLLDQPTDPETRESLSTFLNTGHDGSCRWISQSCVEVKEYNYAKFVRDVREISSASSVRRVWLSYNTNHAIFSAVPQEKLFVSKSPVEKMKLIKNQVEILGIENAHIKDAIAIIKYLTRLEKEVKAGFNWTFNTAASNLKLFRSMQAHYRNAGWLIKTLDLNKPQIVVSSLGYHTVNSPGHYIDGSATIGRTVLFRQPSSTDKEMYTRALIGLIDLTLAKWPEGVYGRELDTFARRPLLEGEHYRWNGWSLIQDPFLQQFGGPLSVTSKHPLFQGDMPLHENMLFSIEPGLVREDKSQLLLKNVVSVKKYQIDNVDMLGFETVSFFPFENKLINYSLLSDYQVRWLDTYNRKCRKKLGPILTAEGRLEELEWLKNRTRPILADEKINGYSNMKSNAPILLPVVVSVYLYISFLHIL